MQKDIQFSSPFLERYDLSALGILTGIVILFCLHLTTYYHYLLFHNLAELFSVIIAMTMFIIAINCWKSIQNQYVLFVGVAYFFIGFIDLLHTLAFKGMPIFTDYSYYAPQFWIAARVLESLSMVVAFSFLGTGKLLNRNLLMAIFLVITALLVSSILYFKTFPACFVAGQGLTPFKKIAEYFICGMLALSLLMLYQRRHLFDAKVYRLIAWSIVAMIATELCFTMYVSDSMNDAINEIGHLLKIVAFYLLYKAVVVTGLADPINLLFRNLKTSEAHLSEAQQIARLGTWKWTLKTDEWLFSSKVLSFAGMSENDKPTLQELLGKFEAKDRLAVQDALHRLKQGGEHIDLKLSILNSKQNRYAQMRGVLVKNEQGEPIRIAGTLQDVTDEHRLQEALAAVKDKEKFELLMQTAGDGIHLFDYDGNVVEVNDMFCKMLGYSRDELLKMNVAQWDAKFNPADLKSKIDENFSYANLFETRHRRKDGVIIDVEVNAKAISYGGKTVLWNSARDITERKQAEQELKRSNAELEQFSYAVSHDMRQPLRMISSYLQLLEMELGDTLDDEKRTYFNFAVDGAKRIDAMLVDLLEYSRIGRMGEPMASVESRDVLDEALKFLQPSIAEAQAQLNIAGHWPKLICNQDELVRLFQNLVSNAVKYRLAGRAPEITLTSEISNDEWKLCVADNGIGIIPDQIQRLFKVFKRLQTRDVYEGTGIGLALCRKIVEHHKGRIWVESAGEGCGSQFYVVLPIN